MSKPSNRPTCATCPFWFRMYKDMDDGQCRKNAPTGSPFQSAYASTWCGDHPDFQDWLNKRSEAELDERAGALPS